MTREAKKRVLNNFKVSYFLSVTQLTCCIFLILDLCIPVLKFSGFSSCRFSSRVRRLCFEHFLYLAQSSDRNVLSPLNLNLDTTATGCDLFISNASFCSVVHV